MLEVTLANHMHLIGGGRLECKKKMHGANEIPEDEFAIGATVNTNIPTRVFTFK